MKFSGPEIKSEQAEYARRNNEYLEDRLNKLESDMRAPSPDSPKSKQGCCFIIVLLVVGAVALIGYFFYIIKDETMAEYDKWKNFLLEPAQETRDSQELNQVENVLNGAADQIDTLSETYQKAENTYETGKKIYEAVK